MTTFPPFYQFNWFSTDQTGFPFYVVLFIWLYLISVLVSL